MGTETELKFEVAPQDLRRLKAAPAVKGRKSDFSLFRHAEAQAGQEWRLTARAAQRRQKTPDRQIPGVRRLLQTWRMGAGD